MQENAESLESSDEAEVKIDQEKMYQALSREQNLPLGVVSGVAAAIIAALIWAVLTMATERQFGYAAIGVGVLVGFAVRLGGKGIDQIFGIVGAALGFFGTVLGNFFSYWAMAAKEVGGSYEAGLSLLNEVGIIKLFSEDLDFFSILFYGLALYFGYKYAFRSIDEEEMAGFQEKQ